MIASFEVIKRNRRFCLIAKSPISFRGDLGTNRLFFVMSICYQCILNKCGVVGELCSRERENFVLALAEVMVIATAETLDVDPADLVNILELNKWILLVVWLSINTIWLPTLCVAAILKI